MSEDSLRKPAERTTKSVFLRLPADLHAVLSRKAQRKKTTIQKIIISTIDEAIIKGK